MSGAWVIAGYAVRESIRRRVFAVVLALTLAFLGLYGWGVTEYFDASNFEGAAFENVPREDFDVAGAATLLGLAMFGTQFLGAVLAVFLTMGAVRGDADRGLLQPLVVRPVGRRTVVLARLAAAGAVAGAYVVAVFAAAVVITGVVSGWWPDRIVEPALALAGAAVILAALSLLGSVVLSATANGIAVFMVFGAGLVAGLLGQIGDALSSETLEDIGRVGSYVLPFEGLYQSALGAITADTSGLAGFVLQLGPFGGAQEGGPLLALWAVAYLAAVASLAVLALNRRDLSQ